MSNAFSDSLSESVNQELDAYDLRQCSQRSGVSIETLRRLVRSGELPSALINTRRVILRPTWERWLRELEAKSTPSKAS